MACRPAAVESPNPAKLIKASLPAVTTTYTLRLDADTSVGDDLARAVAAVAAKEPRSVRSSARSPTALNVVTNLQALEYRMAMLARHFRPWLTSGACFLARTDSLRTDHGSPLALDSGRGHRDRPHRACAADAHPSPRHHVETDAPDTWQALVRQRRLWWAGTFRHWWINWIGTSSTCLS